MTRPGIARLSRLLCLFGATIGVLGLLGWLANVAFLTTIVAGKPAMMPNTALSLFLLGLGGVLRDDPEGRGIRRIAASTAALLVLSIGLATLSEYALGTDLGIDSLLISSNVGPFPGRPSPPTALALALLAAGLLTLDVRPSGRARPSEWMIISAALIAFAALQGLIHGAGELYRWAHAPVIGVSLPTAISVLLVATGLLLERPNAGMMRLVTSPRLGGLLVRRWVLPAIIVPTLLALSIVRIFSAFGIEHRSLLVAVIVTSTTIVSLVLLLMSALPLNRVHASLERNRAQLRWSEARSSGIISTSADAIISIDEDQRITLFNEGAEKIFGYSKEEVLGESVDLLIPPRFRTNHRRHVERFASGRENARSMDSRGTQVFGLRRDGEEFPADAAISKLEIGGTRILTVALRDTTEQYRRQREQRLLAEVGRALATTLDYEETLTHVAELAVRELADVCIVDIRAENGEVRRLRAVSRNREKAWLCEKLMQGPTRPKEVSGSVLESKRASLVHHPSAGELESLTENAEQLHALLSVELRSVMILPLIARENVLGLIAFLSTAPSRGYDPTDLRLAEQVAERAALAIDNAYLYRKAQRAIEIRDEVLGIVAHDLRNPLGTILGQAELLRVRGRELEQVARHSLAKIETAAHRMKRLINDLLDIARIDAGPLAIEKARVSSAQVVADVAEAQKPQLASAELKLELELGRDLPDLWADRDRLLQVFENLVGNALKFTSPGGCITVGAAPREGEVLFWVADTGAGISPRDLPHVFERFWQARNSHRLGAGLGLQIVRGIVEAHGGRVWAESTPGVGSVFYFTIPVAPRLEETRSQAAPSSP